MKPSRPLVAPHVGYYLAGFTDGEGCFYIGRANTNKPRPSYLCGFTIKLRDDDRAVLEWLQQRTGVGRIGYTAGGRKNPQASWRVHDKKGCVYLTELFDQYPLLSKKKRDYAIWREAVFFWSSTGGRGTDWAEMEGYYEALRDVRVYRPFEAAAFSQSSNARKAGRLMLSLPVPLLPLEELWSEDGDVVWLPADGLTRSQARYRGYRLLNNEHGIGHFYPDEFAVRKVWMRRDLRPGPEGEGSHLLCLPGHPMAAAYWQVRYEAVRRVWRDGHWRRA